MGSARAVTTPKAISQRETARGAHVIVIGLGNIGSTLVRLVARLPKVRALTLIDFDTYDADNLLTQDIRREDVGQTKAVAQRTALRKVRPELQIITIADSIERVPWGVLRGDLILTALDSRHARLVASTIAWRLGIVCVDSGIHKDEMLARVTVYGPGSSSPCIQCSWSEDDYRALDQRYPCKGSLEVPSTDAPQCLGALAASVQALETRKYLESKHDYRGFSREILWNARSCTQHVSKLVYNPACRFDHARIDKLSRIPLALDVATLGQLFDRISSHMGKPNVLSLAVAGQTFSRISICPDCGETCESLHLEPRLSHLPIECPSCTGSMSAPGWFTANRLLTLDLTPEEFETPVVDIGLTWADVIEVTFNDQTSEWLVIDRDSE